MSAHTEELIAINDLLIEREAVFSRIHDIENKIQSLVPDLEFPMPAPISVLPSESPTKKQQRKTKAQNRKPVKIRRLEPDECAYRITIDEDGEPRIFEALNLKNLDGLINEMHGKGIIKKIESIGVHKNAISILYPET